MSTRSRHPPNDDHIPTVRAIPRQLGRDNDVSPRDGYGTTMMIRLQKPRRVYVFPLLRIENPRPLNHIQPSNPQKSLYLLPVCPFAVLLFCS